ncbi:MAG: 4-hydroxy-3-methylbut-2-enyl diphosphate reductase [Treponema sp.]|nr:4-hydroxy-3-methylbut-2-enyl diphosphate reductase [Treponema sp.]
MKVFLADVLGYCMGVRRAMDCANKALCDNSDKRVYSLGPLIHNRIALEGLQNKGMTVLDEENIDSINEESIIVIRAHGVAPSVSNKLISKNLNVVNATCPKVTASQRNAEKYAKHGYLVLLVGDKNHGEVTSIAGYAGTSFKLIENIQEAKSLKIDYNQKAVLLCQTTYNAEDFLSIAEEISKKVSDLKILNTICSATKERQEALKKLCPDVDGVIVVGGKNSANTKRLYQIAQENCKRAALIETWQEIPEDFYNLEKVGITAGASTPDEVIMEVKDKLETR